MDSYYRDLSTVPKDDLEHWNFDQPTSIDFKLLIEHVVELSAGRSIMKPIYLFPSHTRAAEGVEVIPMRYVILDGLFSLYWQEILDVCQFKIFVRASDIVCFQRRLVRDPVERGFTEEFIKMQYRETVRPMYLKHVHPTKVKADIIINGEERVGKSVDLILDYLGK